MPSVSRFADYLLMTPSEWHNLNIFEMSLKNSIVAWNSWKLRLAPGKPHWRGWLSTVDHLVATSLDQLLLILQTLFTFFTKQVNSIRRPTVLNLPLQLVFPACPIIVDTWIASIFQNKSRSYSQIFLLLRKYITYKKNE